MSLSCSLLLLLLLLPCLGGGFLYYYLCAIRLNRQLQRNQHAALQDGLRQLLASGAPSIQEQIVPTLTAVLPQAMGSEV